MRRPKIERHRRVEEEELDLHGLRVLGDEDQDQQDEDAEPPGPPVGLLLRRLKVPSIGHGATLYRGLRHSTAWIAACMSPKVGTVSVRRPPGPCTTNDGVPSNPSFPASALVLARAAFHRLEPRSRFQRATSGTPAPLAIAVRNGSVTYPDSSGALVAVEELDVVPVPPLLGGRERRLAAMVDCAVRRGADHGPLAKVVARGALAHDLVDELGRDRLREALAHRALEIPVLDHPHLRLRIAEDGAVLGDPVKLLLDEADVLEVGVAPRPAARLADDDQDSDRADGEEGDAARDLPGAGAVHVATARRRERAWAVP